MTGEEQSVREGLKLEALPQTQPNKLNSTRAIGLSLSLFIVPLVLFSLIQYYRYGFDLFLGWDTSTYAWWAELFYNGGLSYLAHISYPNLYVVSLAGFGLLVGQASLAEKILPFIVALPLAYACYRLTLDITSDRTLGYLSALLGGIAINTLRLESDLHRNLLSLSVSLVLGALVSSQLTKQSFSWRSLWKNVLLVWLPMLAVVAYTQIETYLVLAITLLIMFSFTRSVRNALLGTGLLSLPIIVALPLILPFLSSYAGSIGLIGLTPQPPSSIAATTFLFLGGFALPWTGVGMVRIYEKARVGTQAALFVLAWLLALMILLPIATIAGLPYERFLYVVPIPIIIASGAKSILQTGSALLKRVSPRRSLPTIRPGTLRKNAFSLSVGILLIAVLITSSTTDSFLRPYVSQIDVSRLTRAAGLLRQSGYGEPILVMYGPTAAGVNTIYRAYFGIDIPNNLAYYGKLQYIFTLPDPRNVYSWQYDPSFEMSSSIKDRTEILDQLGSPSAIRSHAIVIAGGDTYDRPLSEMFIQQYETAPGTGIYIIPPNQLTANQTDDWRLYAYSDWKATTSSFVNNATWTQSQKALNYVGRGSAASFSANYTISLAQSWTTMQLALRFYDYQQPFVFPDTSNATLAPLQALFDNQPIFNHQYSGQQATTVTYNLTDVASGTHTITIKSTSIGAASAVAVALDTIQVCPQQCQ